MPGMLTLEDLRAEVDAGRIDTVLLAIADMQGRLQGKRLAAGHFLDEVLEHNAEGCNYLLAVDVDMNTVGGYAMSSWELGYGDFVFRPDVATLRRVPWHEGTALVMCDLEWEDGTPVVASPRQILRRQVRALAERGWQAMVGTELEFMVFRDSYEDAWRKGYRDLAPANDYNVDYSLLGTARIEPLLRGIRNGMTGAGLRVESAKGECNYGQHEIAFRYDEALRTSDGHAIYKNGAKEIAAQAGCSLTFMAKYNQREGNSCHIHLSFRNLEGEPLLAGPGHALSGVGEQFLAGQLACLRELTLFLAPNVNSYKRFAAGSFAPTAALHAAIARLVKKVPEGPSAVKGLSFGSQLDGMVVCDERGQPLRPAMIWMDGGRRRRRAPSPGGSRGRASTVRWEPTWTPRTRRSRRCGSGTRSPRSSRRRRTSCRRDRTCSARQPASSPSTTQMPPRSPSSTRGPGRGPRPSWKPPASTRRCSPSSLRARSRSAASRGRSPRSPAWRPRRS